MVIRELVAGVFGLLPVALVLWVAVLDDDDRTAVLERVAKVRDRLTGAAARGYRDSAPAAFAILRRARLVDEENMTATVAIETVAVEPCGCDDEAAP
jgi:cadmium resistance protein CadD (predicted permease)